MAKTIPIILAILILNIRPKVSSITFRFNSIGVDSPNSSP